MMTMVTLSRSVVLAGLCCLFAASAPAQEFRATMQGRVTDADGLGVPGVVVSATNPRTNEAVSATTSAEGLYSLPFLRPAVYTVTAELSGFRRHVQERVQLEVGQTVTLNIALLLGGVAETVTVTAETSQLEVAKADRGIVIDNERINELPLNARNPFMLSYLSPGVTYNGPAIFQRPFDNGAIADWSINGGQNRNNEFLLDGAPNNSLVGGNNIAYVPPVDAVQEFKIITNSYDAQYGRTAGGVVNVLLKSGTNALHGSLYEFARRKPFDSNEYQFKLRNRAKPDHSLDQYGFQVNGPARIPGLYDGRNKTFFMVAWEGYSEELPAPGTFTVPDAAQLRGDFSNLRNAQGQLITIFDPATGRTVNGSFVRDAFPGNIIPPERINAIARELSQYFLRPNTTPASGDPWRNNYSASTNRDIEEFYNFATKVDQNFGDTTRMFFRYAQNNRLSNSWTNGITTGPAQDGGIPFERLNNTGVVDWVRTMSAPIVLNVRVGLTKFEEINRSIPGLSFDPSPLGFPASLINQLPNAIFPRINVADYSLLGRNRRLDETSTIASVQPNLAWARGSHNIRTGLDMRLSWFRRENNPNMFVFSFDRGFTQRTFNQGDALSGNSIASFLLGAPASGVVENNFYPLFRTNYYAPWLQDDWRVNNRLTVNLGLRWDLGTPVFEQDNRINAGFDAQSVNPASARINQQLFPGYQVRGGLEFAGVDGNSRYPYKRDKNNIQPRVGFTFLVNDRTIVRGGYGLYYPNVASISTQNGFTVQTPLIPSLDANRTSTFPFSNPFSQGITQPPGSSRGLETFLGREPNFSNTGFENPYVHQFSIGFQRALPWRTTVDVSYVGSRTRQVQSNWAGFNEPPLSLRNQCDVTQGGSAAFCNELLTNPFFGVPGFEGTARFTSPTLSRFELSRPFPQFGAFSELDRNDGRIGYDSLQVYANKRVSHGLSLAGTWTLARHNVVGPGGGSLVAENGFRDDLAGALQEGPYFTDRRHRMTMSGVYRLPFGQGRKFLNASGPVVEALAGGWEVAGIWLFNTGRPWELPANVFYVKDAKLPQLETSATSIRAVRNCVAQMSNTGVVTLLAYSVAAGCTEPNFVIRPAFTGRTTNFRDDAIRLPSFYQFDLNFAKTTGLPGGLRLQLRAEVYNVLNQAVYDERQYVNDPNNPLFGTIDRTSVRQSNFPRYGQLGIKLIF